MLKILYNLVFGEVTIKCDGCKKEIKINSYDYHKDKKYICNIGCALALSNKDIKLIGKQPP
jgi:hypothetical protein